MPAQGEVLVEHDLRHGRTDAGSADFQQAFVVATDAGNTQIVALVDNRRIRVLWIQATNAGGTANRVRLQSDTTNITAQHDTAPDGGGWNLNTAPAFFCQTAVGEPLNVNLEANGTIDVTLGYVEF